MQKEKHTGLKLMVISLGALLMGGLLLLFYGVATKVSSARKHSACDEKRVITANLGDKILEARTENNIFRLTTISADGKKIHTIAYDTCTGESKSELTLEQPANKPN